MKNIVIGVLEAALVVALIVGIVALLDSCASQSLYYQVSDFVNS